jgi:hypothetical protein
MIGFVVSGDVHHGIQVIREKKKRRGRPLPPSQPPSASAVDPPERPAPDLRADPAGTSAAPKRS